MSDGGPAFPSRTETSLRRDDGTVSATMVEDGFRGMTLRDYFAAKAMQAMVSGHLKHNRDPSRRGGNELLLDYTTPDCEGVEEDTEAGASIIAATAYSVSDAMLAEREKKP